MIAITGLAGSGKDTAALQINKRTGRKLYALAAPIKDVVHALFNVSECIYGSRDLKERELTFIVTPESLDAAADVYIKHGLQEFEMFHDAWGTWIELLGLKYKRNVYHVEASLRTLYQLIGTEWGRSVDEDIWLKIAPEGCIITDIRRTNEAQFFLDKGYKLFEIKRPNIKKIPNSGHASEKGIDPLLPRITIFNDEGIEDLHAEVDRILGALSASTSTLNN